MLYFDTDSMSRKLLPAGFSPAEAEAADEAEVLALGSLSAPDSRLDKETPP